MTIATLAAACAALVIAPSAATAKTVHFDGRANLAHIPDPDGFPRHIPNVEMKVAFQGKVPKVVLGGTLATRGLYGPCLPTSGCGDYRAPLCFANLGNEAETGSFDDIKVKRNRTFSGTLRSHVTTMAAGNGALAINTARVTGKITKRSVTGTVRAYAHEEATAGGSPPQTCDTGVITYTVPAS